MRYETRIYETLKTSTRSTNLALPSAGCTDDIDDETKDPDYFIIDCEA